MDRPQDFVMNSLVTDTEMMVFRAIIMYSISAICRGICRRRKHCYQRAAVADSVLKRIYLIDF